MMEKITLKDLEDFNNLQSKIDKAALFYFFKHVVNAKKVIKESNIIALLKEHYKNKPFHSGVDYYETILEYDVDNDGFDYRVFTGGDGVVICFNGHSNGFFHKIDELQDLNFDLFDLEKRIKLDKQRINSKQ